MSIKLKLPCLGLLMQMLNKKRPSERSDAPVLVDAELIPAFPSEIGKSEHEEESIDQRFVNLLNC